ncbi:MAG TPA: LysR family transcriptional regulator [Ramlibacter sp.]|uniref:LysR family transcriptional regulator n=1 Tax=Ramlibacter sp. TaxID=1917967 RepID=UPI002CACBF68|nr:LysR family transcriptional regulator [Ramlibacter sp.]HVZ44180.1 LysR family transcriptional regulator [Ramlibacter sp.]
MPARERADEIPIVPTGVFEWNYFVVIASSPALMTGSESQGPRTWGQALSPAKIYRIDRLRLRHLRMLEVIHRCGSLGAAARELGVTQPAVTNLLKEIEEVFEATLVERDVRGGRLTDAGVAALERLTIAMASIDIAMNVAKAKSQTRLLRLGCIQVAGIGVLPAAIAHMEARGSLGQIKLVEGTARSLLSALLEGEIDAFIGWVEDSLLAAVDVRRLMVEPLSYGVMQVVGSFEHPLVNRMDVTVDDLKACSWILPRLHSHTRAAFQHLFLDNGSQPPEPTIESWSLHNTLLIVAASRLLAVAPNDAVEFYSQLGLVKQIDVAPLLLDRTRVSLVALNESRKLPAIEALIEAIRHVRHNRLPIPL